MNTHDLIGKKFRYFKGGEYVVLQIAQHADVDTQLVIYQDLKGEKVWTRPINDFLGKVHNDGKVYSRFEEIGIADTSFQSSPKKRFFDGIWGRVIKTVVIYLSLSVMLVISEVDTAWAAAIIPSVVYLVGGFIKR